jgi:hypothetical protein
MLNSNESGAMEYAALTERSRTIERTAIMTWTIATTAAAVLLAMAIADNSPGRMLAVVFAAAVGLYPMLHARHQIRLMAGYMEEFCEGRMASNQWHSRLAQLRMVPGVQPADDWVITMLSSLVVVAAVVFSWQFASAAKYGAAISGFVTACGASFVFHCITETSRIAQMDFTAAWRKAGPREAERARAS